MLTELRQSVADVLTAAGIDSRPYTTEDLTPPCAFVVPGQPYLDSSASRVDVPFVHVLAGLDVLLLVGEETSDARVDELVETVFAALDADHHVTRVTRPGFVAQDPRDPKSPRLLGVVLSLEAIADRPVPQEIP